MEVLWAAPGALRGREVADRLPGYAYTTIATILDRLSRKGQLRRTADGRVHRYATTGTAGTHAAKAMSEALGAVDDPADALSQFVAAMPDEQVDALRSALRRRR